MTKQYYDCDTAVLSHTAQNRTFVTEFYVILIKQTVMSSKYLNVFLPTLLTSNQNARTSTRPRIIFRPPSAFRYCWCKRQDIIIYKYVCRPSCGGLLFMSEFNNNIYIGEKIKKTIYHENPSSGSRVDLRRRLNKTEDKIKIFSNSAKALWKSNDWL